MKALIVAEETTEIIYLWHDDEFEEKLAQIMHNDKNFSIDVHVQMFFAPIILSYFTLKEKVNQECSSIRCDENTVIVFRQHFKFLYIGIDRDVDGCEEKLYRELSYLQHTFDFLYGLCSRYQLGSTSQLHKRMTWNSVSTLYETYSKLCATENTFLFEAIERLRVTQDVLEVFDRLLQKCVGFVKTSLPNRNVQHAYIIVGTRLLNYFSSHSAECSISTSDILQTMTLVASKFSTARDNDKLIDEIRSSENESEYYVNYAESQASPTVYMEEDVTVLDDDDDIFLKTDVDSLFDATSFFSEGNDRSQTPVLVSTSTLNDTESESGRAAVSFLQHPVNEEIIDKVIEDGENSVTDYISSDENAFNAMNDYFSSEEDNTESTIIENCYQVPIYLSTLKGVFIPHILYCIPVTPLVKIVLISRVQHAEISDVICAMMYMLNKIHFEDAGLKITGEEHTLYSLAKCNKLLYRKVKKCKGQARKFGTYLTQNWHKNGLQSLRSYMKNGGIDLISSIERCINETQHRLFTLFKHLFPSSADNFNSDHKETVNWRKMQSYAQGKVSGYAEYISVKSQQNITITFYLSKFPGMVYFTFIKRSFQFAHTGNVSLQENLFQDELYAPSLLLSSSANYADSLFQSMKKKLWRYIYHCYSNVINGKFVNTEEDNDFQFTSYMWFASKERPTELYRLPKVILTGESFHHSPSVFCGEFYKDFLRLHGDSLPSSIVVYHLVCVHLSIIPMEVIKQQIDNLSDIVINNSGTS